MGIVLRIFKRDFIKLALSITVTLFFVLNTTAQTRSNEFNIGRDYTWKVWLDTAAQWNNDKLFLPEELNLNNIKANEPTCGWNGLYKNGIDTKLPVVVEEIFSNGDPTWTYHGVSWFTSTVEVPKDWADKEIRLSVAKKNLRLEVYINENLVGYDIIAGTPYTCNLSEYLNHGDKNRIAFRITNPGGQRGWGDFPFIKWGEYELPAQHDFGGIGGDVKLLVSDKLYINDVFVKNELPAKANNISVQVKVKNEYSSLLNADLLIRIKTELGNEILYENKYPVSIEGKTELLLTKQLTVSEAKLWDIYNPNLYTCEVLVESNDFKDTYNQTFGFRVFEVKANDKGEQNFYLNGKRFRHKSAIDWGFYAHHGYYPSDEMAKKSISNAKAIGHNGINCHRSMGDPLLFDYADKLGLAILEEPGGLDETIKITKGWQVKGQENFVTKVMAHRCLRMVKRDRNHPSMFGYIMANERDVFDIFRKNLMLDMHALDNSKLIVNQSGGDAGGPASHIPHLRPYDNKFYSEYFDDHTVVSESRFQESDLQSHRKTNFASSAYAYGSTDPLKSNSIIYWGEVRCYTGPNNNFAIKQQTKQLGDNRTGYDINGYNPLSDKIESYFNQNNLSETGSKLIQTPSDVTVQAGRGLMYIDGRLNQILMSNHSVDGYAINGWSSGANTLPEGVGKVLEWYSSILDEGRNLKGPASDFNYWNRPLQVALFRSNGKYFKPNDTIKLEAYVINEGVLAQGDYDLQISLKDGKGKQTDFTFSKNVKILGEDTFSQKIFNDFSILIDDNWHAGYLTIEGKLFSGKTMVAKGTEQVLLQNRKSYTNEFNDVNIKVINWKAASKALKEANYKNTEAEKSVLLAGSFPSNDELKELLAKVKKGAHLVVRFDSIWAEKLYSSKILKEKVTQWGGKQILFWNGNGWGYIDHIIGDQAIPSKTTIGTNSWEAPGDPIGFAPFVSNFKQTSYGAWFARPDVLLTLVGEISYGKGKITLLPSYPVDDNNAFNDLMFFSVINTD